MQLLPDSDSDGAELDGEEEDESEAYDGRWELTCGVWRVTCDV